MKTLRPVHVMPWGGVTYDELLKSMDVEILLQAHDDNYQGDSWYLLEDPVEGIGFLTFGWGSCSGCDAAALVSNAEEAAELRDQLWGQIHWLPDMQQMHQWLQGRDWSVEFYDDDPVFKHQFLPAALAHTKKES